MIIPMLKRQLDERYLVHRLRSTSLAGVVGGIVAAGLFAYRFYAQGVLSWDLAAVAATIAVVKLAALAYYRITD